MLSHCTVRSIMFLFSNTYKLVFHFCKKQCMHLVLLKCNEVGPPANIHHLARGPPQCQVGDHGSFSPVSAAAVSCIDAENSVGHQDLYFGSFNVNLCTTIQFFPKCLHLTPNANSFSLPNHKNNLKTQIKHLQLEWSIRQSFQELDSTQSTWSEPTIWIEKNMGAKGFVCKPVDIRCR